MDFADNILVLVLLLVAFWFALFKPKLAERANTAAGFAFMVKSYVIPTAAIGGLTYAVYKSQDTEGKGINYVFVFRQTSASASESTKTHMVEVDRKRVLDFIKRRGYERAAPNVTLLLERMKGGFLYQNTATIAPDGREIKHEPYLGLYAKGPIDRDQVRRELEEVVSGINIEYTINLNLMPAENQPHRVVFDLSEIVRSVRRDPPPVAH